MVELGPSAGLNLVWDRYRYEYANGAWGDPSSPLTLRGEERMPVPLELLALSPRVASRVGVDAEPIDVTTDEGARLLKSFVWADQTWRLELLDQAIAALRADPPELVRGDLLDELPRLLERRRAGSLSVVYATAVLGYLSDEDRARFRELMRGAGAVGPLAFVSTGQSAHDEHTRWAMKVTIWPGGDRESIALADFHGAWLDWLA
jgi:hypothetical protein